MIIDVSEGCLYLSPSGVTFKVLHKAKHGQDCSYPMIVYTNIEKTQDRDIGEIWVISESLFLKLFKEKLNG